MNISARQNYRDLLIRLVSINLLFVIFMTFLSFLVFLTYDSFLWSVCPKTDIVKVFFQNIRFNLSIVGYFNIPVFMFLMLLLAFKPSFITKASVGIVKSYYLLAFISVFSLLTLSYLVNNMPEISAIMSADYFSKLSFIYSHFTNPVFITMLITMSILFLITVIFFILFLKFVLKSKEYAVDDSSKAMATTMMILLICVLFAKGKIIGHLTVKDAAVTPVIQLNEYAVSGPYKIFNDLKNFNFSEIIMIKDRRKLIDSGFSVAESDESKAMKQLFKFTPKK